MKKLYAITVFSLLAVTQAVAQKGDKEAEKMKAQMEQQQQSMEAWRKYMEPGEMHMFMRRTNGSFNARIAFYEGEGAEPTTSMATCKQTTILGERYQVAEYKGTMMGMPFEGHSTLGFDNARQVFVSTWIDNMGTGIMYSEGKFDRETGLIELKGFTTDPATGKSVDFREQLDMRNDGRILMTMYDKRDGKEYKSMEIELLRSAE